MDSHALKKRITDFSHRCVKLALALPDTSLGKLIRSQLIRSSTSAAANYRAVCIAQSKPHFISKLSIVMEETDESCFWMEFIIDEQLLKKQRVLSLLVKVARPSWPCLHGLEAHATGELKSMQT